MPAPFSSAAALFDNNSLLRQLHPHSASPSDEMDHFALRCPDSTSFLPPSSMLYPPSFKSGHSSHLSSLSPHECSLSTAFSLSRSHSRQQYEHDPTVIEALQTSPYDMSPSSSISSDFDRSVSCSNSFSSLGPCSLETFAATSSRVVRLFDFPYFASSFLRSVFTQQQAKRLPVPITMWELRPDYFGPRHDQRSLWAIFKSHDEACTALSLSGSIMSVVPALESDLEPFHKLRRFDLNVSLPQHSSSFPPSSTCSTQVLHMTTSVSGLHGVRFGLESGTLPRAAYTISSNPPNPRTSFRLGDWICSSPSCAAHNFGRNVACIGCGYPRSSNKLPPSPSAPSTIRPLASPRFATSPNFPICFPPTSPSQTSPLLQPPSYQPPPASHVQNVLKPVGLPHPPLTPSGRAFSTGGRVQNVSSDPLTPCVMYWPDNESLPEQGQIRPGGLVGVPQPPILNTGNRGPIEHQPGDWICAKCNYLNWRRRKVCQTCFPYAEGNGDSISAAVQAERIALLTSVLSQNQTLLANKSPPSSTTCSSYGLRSQSLTPPENQCSFVDISPKELHGSVHRSQSHFDLSSQYMDSRPIYQTSGYRQPSPSGFGVHVHAPAPLLPSFLQDIVQSPALSPASSSSADLSFEEYDETFPYPVRSSPGRLSNGKESSSNFPPDNIWRLDGEESKTLSALASSNRQDLQGSHHNGNQEILRLSTINIT